MSIDQVKAVSKKEIVARDAGSIRGTHAIRAGHTDVWLDFEGNQLRWIQINYLVGLEKMDSLPRKELCER